MEKKSFEQIKYDTRQDVAGISIEYENEPLISPDGYENTRKVFRWSRNLGISNFNNRLLRNPEYYRKPTEDEIDELAKLSYKNSCDQVSGHVADEVAKKTQENTRLSPEPLYKFKCYGAAWTITYEGRKIDGLKGGGFKILHFLISNPNKSIDASSLSALLSPPPDSDSSTEVDRDDGDSISQDSVSDRDAIKSIKAKREDLFEEFMEAERNNDAKKYSIQDQIAKIDDYLKQNLKSGKARSFVDDHQRAKNRVRKSIERALESISKLDEVIARHFHNALKPISTFSYHPDKPIKWDL